MKVSVVGTGYVGLVTGVCFAEKGHQITCVDVDQAKVDSINSGVPPIYEPGLQDLLRKHVGQRLQATTDLVGAVQRTDLSLIAVGTPFDGREIDLTYIKAVSKEIGQALRKKSGYHVVVVKSTVVPGTTDDVVRPILEEASGKKAGVDFGVGMNPEFLTEGEAVGDFLFPDRIVLGGADAATMDQQARLYEGFPGVEVLRVNNKTAEMIKYASNALLATLISFSNEIGNLCAAIKDADVLDVMRGVHVSRYLTVDMPDGRRVQPHIVSFLAAGCGFGGSCFPKDVKALAAHGEKYHTPMHVLDAVLEVNEQQPARVIQLLKKHFASLDGVRIAVLGLAFRPDTSDMRESPAIPIVRRLLQEGASLKGYDPVAMAEARKLFSAQEMQLCGSLAEAVSKTDAVVLVTRWDEFRNIPELLASQDPPPLVVDGRRMLDKTKIARYEGIGLDAT
jgi:UDPglucose 6-dehydrogenase/GDP-mannose 6-dehydrogenase